MFIWQDLPKNSTKCPHIVNDGYKTERHTTMIKFPIYTSFITINTLYVTGRVESMGKKRTNRKRGGGG